MTGTHDTQWGPRLEPISLEAGGVKMTKGYALRTSMWKNSFGINSGGREEKAESLPIEPHYFYALFGMFCFTFAENIRHLPTFSGNKWSGKACDAV